MDAPNINHLWAGLIVEELIRCGVRLFVVSPGSRSTPLAMAAAANPRAAVTVHYDERGAGFFALGCGKAGTSIPLTTPAPAALICTSGTATANYLPAVVEAAMGHTPLVVLTADRPPEMLDTGANQTIRQRGLYGTYVRWEHTLPCPTTEVSARAVLGVIDQAVGRATGATPGPVHLNCPFREPLAPTPGGGDLAAYTEALGSWRQGDGPMTWWTPEKGETDITLGSYLTPARYGCFLVGALPSGDENLEAWAELDDVSWLVLPDVASPLRRSGWSEKFACCDYDLALESERFRELFRPDAVVHLGAAMTSKRLMQHLQAHPPSVYVHVSPHDDNVDPWGLVTHRFRCSLDGFFMYHYDCFTTAEAKAESDASFEGRAELSTAFANWREALDRAVGSLGEPSDASHTDEAWAREVCALAAKARDAAGDALGFDDSALRSGHSEESAEGGRPKNLDAPEAGCEGRVLDETLRCAQSDRKEEVQRNREGEARGDHAGESAGYDPPALTEPAVCRVIAERSPANAVLFFGNSMPIRDMDAFGGALPAFELPEDEKPEYACHTPQTTVFANRGASGIDGCIATAAGIGRGLGHPVVAVIGDVAALHDLNSLALLKQAKGPVVLVVLNNDGGGIFHFLPVAETAPADVFEQLFATPHGMTFEHAAAQFGIRYERPASLDAFRAAFDAAFREPAPVLIEVVTDRAENVRVHRAAADSVRRTLDGSG